MTSYCAQRLLRKHRDVRADEADLDRGILRLEPASALDVVGQRRRAGVHDHQVVVLGDREHVVNGLPMRGRVNQRAARHEGGGLRQPRRIPERSHLAFRLVARAGAAVEAVKGRRAQEQSFQQRGPSAAQSRNGCNAICWCARAKQAAPRLGARSQATRWLPRRPPSGVLPRNAKQAASITAQSQQAA